MELAKIREEIQNEVEAHREELIELSMKIHSNPEVGWKEHKASQWLSEYLEKQDFTVERGFCDLPTSFRARFGDGKPVIAFLSEYDATTETEHGCGHNVIATIGVGAGLGAKRLVELLGAGTILILGCPAEELLGGKVLMVERGAFEGIDVAMMMHPRGGPNRAGFRTTASITLNVEFWGKEAHAASDPWNGISALEALVLAFNNINGLRMHIKDGARVGGIITDGGKAANVVPGHAAGTFMVRATENAYLDELQKKVLDCFEGAAKATGARLEYRWGMRCEAMQNNNALMELCRTNMESLGGEVEDVADVAGSTDLGNVSVIVPSIHPFISICPNLLTFHSAEFAEAAASEDGKRAVIDGAKVLAWTAADVITQPDSLDRIKEEFARMQNQAK